MTARLLSVIAFLIFLGTAVADQKDLITVGVATVLSGDAAVIGANIRRTISQDPYRSPATARNLGKITH